MTTLPDVFTIAPITRSDTQELFELFESEADHNLLPVTRKDIAGWCDAHTGMISRYRTGEAAAACFFTDKTIPVAAGSRAQYDDVRCCWFHDGIVRKRYREKRVFQRVGGATVLHAVASIEGRFPDGVACTFSDNIAGLRSHRRAGMVPVSDEHIINSHPTLRSVDTQAHRTKEKYGCLDRAHVVEVLNPYAILDNAEWMSIAYDRPVRDKESGAIFKMIDPSEGRSGIRNVLKKIVLRDPAMLEKLGISGPCCTAA